MQSIRIETLPPVHIAYMRHFGPYGESVSQFWSKRFVPFMAANDVFSHPRYGIAHDDPIITPPEQCRYDACVQVSKDFVATGDVQMTVLPGGHYAVSPFKGTGAAIGEVWKQMVWEWLPANGLMPDDRPCFEYYAPDAHYDPLSGVFNCDICLPVKPAR